MKSITRRTAAAAVGAGMFCLVTSALPKPVSAQGGATGTIEGTVRLMGPAPPNAMIRMGADPRCAKINGGKRLTQEIVLKSADGGLANVFVSVPGTFAAVPVPSEPVVIDQQGCMYRPHVVGARVGQVLEIQNSDPTLHNVHSLSMHGNTFNVSQPGAGMTFKFALKNEEVLLHLKCDVHTWMNSYVGVVNTPYFAVTGTNGTFKIAGVPAGKHMVQIWHERYGPLTQEIDVRPGATTSIELSYTGTEKPGAAVGLPMREMSVGALAMAD